MPVNLVVNAQSFPYPETGDELWGDPATDWAIAVTNGMLQKAGGNFTLTADVNFGASFGLLSTYYKSRSSNIAQSGQIRLARTDSVAFRNAANGADLLLTVDGSNNLTFAGATLLTVLGGTLQPVQGGTGLDTSASTGVPTISAGTWSVSARLSALRGGTNLDTSASTGVPSIAAGTWSVAATLAATLGGTAQSSYALGDILYSSATNVLSKLSGNITTTRKFLRQVGNGSVSAAPAWDTLVYGDISPAITVPTVQKFLSTGTTTGYLFTVSTSSTVAVSDTYTNNGNTYTVLAALTAQTGQVLYMSGAGAPLASGTLTRTAGAGTASITFTANTPLATYTTPANVKYIRTRLVGGGGGGSGSGSTTTSGAGGNGGTTAFGALILVATGGSGAPGAGAVTGGAGGTASLGAGLGLAIPGGRGGGGGATTTQPVDLAGGMGGSSFFGGAGASGAAAAAGLVAETNTGSGGGGGGTTNNTGINAGAGGGAGAYIDALIYPTASQTFVYCVGASGGSGAPGTNGTAGGAGAAGLLIVEEFYQ